MITPLGWPTFSLRAAILTTMTNLVGSKTIMKQMPPLLEVGDHSYLDGRCILSSPYELVSLVLDSCRSRRPLVPYGSPAVMYFF